MSELLVLLAFVKATTSDGQTCVESNLVEMFDLINELRAQTTSSTIYSKLTDAYDEIVLNGYFSLQDGT